jgi:hypothetical protein
MISDCRFCCSVYVSTRHSAGSRAKAHVLRVNHFSELLPSLIRLCVAQTGMSRWHFHRNKELNVSLKRTTISIQSSNEETGPFFRKVEFLNNVCRKNATECFLHQKVCWLRPRGRSVTMFVQKIIYEIYKLQGVNVSTWGRIFSARAQSLTLPLLEKGLASKESKEICRLFNRCNFEN